MNYLTRYFVQFNKILQFINQKFINLKENFLCFVLLLFLGFFLGNLFGTVVNSIRQFNIPDSLLIAILISVNEVFNFIIYSNYKAKFSHTFSLKPATYSFLNAFKVGILLGFFLDAFKVGS